MISKKWYRLRSLLLTKCCNHTFHNEYNDFSGSLLTICDKCNNSTIAENKKYSIADMRGNYCLDVVKAEIAKCDVRCANCHRRKTAVERSYKILEFIYQS